MSNAKQEGKAIWKLILFFFSLRITTGPLKKYYMRKLFAKYLNFQIDGFLFIAVYVLMQNFSQMLHFGLSGLEIFVKILLMEQRCVGSTFKLFLSKHIIETKTTYA